MTWLYVPSTSSVSVPEQPASISVSDWRFQLLERSATLSGKPMPATSWYRAYRTKPWMTRLFGRILEPSTADRGVGSWILLLRATRVSHSVALVNARELMTSGICGPMLPALSARFSPASSSLRTWQTTLFSDSQTSKQSYRQWATALQRDCTRRLKSARRMSASASSSWPTPNASQADQGQNDPDGKRGQTLIGAARGQMWQTPRSHETGQYQFDPKMGVNKLTLDGQAQLWATPEATAGSNGGPNCRDSSGRLKLAGQAAHFGPPDPEMPTDGNVTSEPGPVLNPLFVEALMGLPHGWTDCDSQVTGLSRWLQEWRSWIFGGSYSIEVHHEQSTADL